MSSEIYYAQLVEEECTLTVMRGIREVVERQGVFCALYTDRASHFFVTPQAGQAVDRSRLTQVGRALKELGTEPIPAYSPQARGRSERNFGTWQGRLPQELRLRGLSTIEEANAFLRAVYIAAFNQKFAVPAAQRGHAFVPAPKRRLEEIFSIQHERTVNKDNTVVVGHRVFQIEKSRWRATLAGCRVLVREHLDGSVSISYGPHLVARFDRAAVENRAVLKTGKGCGKDGAMERVENQKQVSHPFHSPLEIPHTPRDFHFPTAPTAAGICLRPQNQNGQITCY